VNEPGSGIKEELEVMPMKQDTSQIRLEAAEEYSASS
jgi:hypothetical protein